MLQGRCTQRINGIMSREAKLITQMAMTDAFIVASNMSESVDVETTLTCVLITILFSDLKKVGNSAPDRAADTRTVQHVGGNKAFCIVNTLLKTRCRTPCRPRCSSANTLVAHALVFKQSQWNCERFFQCQSDVDKQKRPLSNTAHVSVVIDLSNTFCKRMAFDRIVESKLRFRKS